MAKNILITGASGFIGSHLVEGGLSRGYEVFAAVRKSSSRQYLTDSRIRFLELDFVSEEKLRTRFLQCKEEGIRFDFVIHNAGITKAHSPKEFYLVNDRYTRNLVEALEETGLIPDKFIYISSLAATGPGDPVSMQPITDESPSNPIDTYGKSKQAAEEYLLSKTTFPSLVIRPTGVYGPREKDYLVVCRNLNKGFELYAGSSGQMISFIYITDLVNMVFEALTSEYVHKTWVVSDGKNYSVSEFSALVKRMLGKKSIKLIVPLPVVHSLAFILEIMYRPFGRVPLLNREKVAIMASRNWQCDPSNILRDLHFTPTYDLEKGLQETISWNQVQGYL